MAAAEPAINEPQQVPPRDFDAEQATIGSMLLEAGACERALAHVLPEDFYWDEHRQVAQAILTVHERKEPVDLISVSAELRRQGLLEQVGGGTYLTALMGTVPTAAHVLRYANIVAEKAVLRRIIAESADIQAGAYSNPADVGTALVDAGERFAKIISERMADTVLRPLTDGLERQLLEMHEHITSPAEPVSAARTGIAGLDRMIGGLEVERMVTLKAETKHGKSQLTKQAVIETARRFRDEVIADPDKPARTVALFVLEEGEKPWWANTISYLSGIDSRVFKRRGYAPRYFAEHPGAEERYWEAWSELGTLGPHLYMNFSLRDVRQIAAVLRAKSRDVNFGLIAVDYFQKLTGFEEHRRTEEYEYRMRAEYIDDLTNELQIPALIPSQITERSDLKRAMAKGAKAIEEKSSLVLEWRRTVENGVLADKGYVLCNMSRNGPGFAPIEVVTDMSCGRYTDAEDWRREQAVRHEQTDSE